MMIDHKERMVGLFVIVVFALHISGCGVAGDYEIVDRYKNFEKNSVIDVQQLEKWKYNISSYTCNGEFHSTNDQSYGECNFEYDFYFLFTVGYKSWSIKGKQSKIEEIRVNKGFYVDL